MTARASTTSQLRQRAGLEFLTWAAFDGYPVDALVTTKGGGVSADGDGCRYGSLNLSFSVGDSPANVVENRRRVAAALGAELSSFVFAQQVHGRGAHVVTPADRGRGAQDPAGAVPGTDILVTRDPGTVLAVLAADCVPAVLYDPGAHVLACVHAGWRGTVARALHAAVDAMAALGTRPRDVIAALGPAVAPDRYQVGEDVKAAAEQAFGDAARPVVRPDGNGKWLFDLWEANRLVLREAGVPAGQVHVAGIATGPVPGLFFSHRAEQPCGRFAAVARLAPRGGA
jgi:YfiH family protein